MFIHIYVVPVDGPPRLMVLSNAAWYDVDAPVVFSIAIGLEVWEALALWMS